MEVIIISGIDGFFCLGAQTAQSYTKGLEIDFLKLTVQVGLVNF